MKNFSKMLCLLMLLAIALPYNSKADSKKMYLMEGFTNSGCAPCASTWPIVDPILLANSDIFIPIKFHTAGPDNTDPMYLTDPAMNNGRSGYYNPPGVPHLVFNGTASAHPMLIDSLVPDKDALRDDMSPITIGVLETKNGANTAVKITLSSSVAISGAKLRVAVVQYSYDFEGNNGEPNHRWVVRKMLDNVSGKPVEIGTNPEEHNFSYTANAAWDANQLYIVAFVQKDDTKEILQAGTDLNDKISIAGITSEGKYYQSIERNASVSKVFKVKNLGTTKETFNISVSESSFILDAEVCKTSIDKVKVTLEPGATEDVVLTVQSNDQAYYARIIVKAAPVPSDRIPVADSTLFDVLTKDSKYAIYIGLGNSALFPYTFMKDDARYAEDLAVIPAVFQDIFVNFPPTQFDLAVFAYNANSYTEIAKAQGMRTINAINAMLDNDKRVLLTNEFGASLIGSSTDPASPGFRDFMKNRVGMTGVSAKARYTANANNQITAINTFTVTGIANDPIGSSINTVTCNEYNQQSFPYYNLISESMEIDAGNEFAVPFCYYDGKTSSIAGVRSEFAKGRLVYMSFGFDAIKSNNVRNGLIESALVWLTSNVSDSPRITVSVDDINFDEVKVGENSSREITITNTGLETLEVSSIIIGNGKEVFTLNGGDEQVQLATDETYTFDVVFTPKGKKDYYGDVTIVSNSKMDSEIYVTLFGSGVADIEVPHISISSSSVAFDSVAVLKTKEISVKISNTGTAPLTLQSLTFSSNDPAVFEVLEADITPYIVESGDYLDITLLFQPSEVGNFTGVLDIQSNDAKNNIISISMNGRGYQPVDPGSVNEPVKSSNGNFTMKTAPNPMANNGAIEFTVSNSPVNVEMYIIDASGKSIESIYNSSSAFGNVLIPVNASKYSNGYYTVVANVNGEQITIPMIIAK